METIKHFTKCASPPSISGDRLAHCSKHYHCSSHIQHLTKCIKWRCQTLLIPIDSKKFNGGFRHNNWMKNHWHSGFEKNILIKILSVFDLNIDSKNIILFLFNIMTTQFSDSLCVQLSQHLFSSSYLCPLLLQFYTKTLLM